jgi:hypothetical protein
MLDEDFRIERLDVRLIEYGPTPMPVFAGAEVVGVRAHQLAEQILALPDPERRTLADLLQAGTPTDTSDVSDEPAEPSGPDPQLMILRHRQLKHRLRMEDIK